MPRPLRPDEHYDREYERERAKINARTDARNAQSRYRKAAEARATMIGCFALCCVAGICLVPAFFVGGSSKRAAEQEQAAKAAEAVAAKVAATRPASPPPPKPSHKAQTKLRATAEVAFAGAAADLAAYAAAARADDAKAMRELRDTGKVTLLPAGTPMTVVDPVEGGYVVIVKGGPAEGRVGHAAGDAALAAE